MPVTPSPQMWVVCASCGEIVQHSADAQVQRRYHSPTCRDQAHLIRRMRERGELPPETPLAADTGEVADPSFSRPDRGRKAALGLLAAVAVAAMAALLVSGSPGSKAGPPAASERQAAPVTGSSTPAGGPSPQTVAPSGGTASPSPSPQRVAGGIPAPAPSHAPSPAGVTTPAGSVLVTFQDGTNGWSAFWGNISDTPAASPAFDGTRSLLLTASPDRFSAVGTTTDVAQLKPGDAVTYHVWSSGQSGSVQPFIYDDSHVARFGQPTSTTLSSSAGWFTLTWTIPPTPSVLAIGLQVTNPGSGSIRLAIAELSWPKS